MTNIIKICSFFTRWTTALFPEERGLCILLTMGGKLESVPSLRDSLLALLEYLVDDEEGREGEVNVHGEGPILDKEATERGVLGAMIF